jgi:PAS domain S-box-containing protein
LWLKVVLSPVRDMYDEISKIIFIGNDETKEKLMEIETQKQTELLKQQEDELNKSRAELRMQLKQNKIQAEKQIKEIEKVKLRNERTLEGSVDAIITIDQGGVVKFFNKAAENLWKTERDVVLGRNIKKLFPKENYDDEFLKSYLNPKADKTIGERRKINITNSEGEDISVIILLSQAILEDEITYTAFIQNI